ncbi:type I-E CRISPR-associated protein Cas7/Cse4/CasC [Embleya sp. NPDC008237]|uniref:type I-E CRISPR-associated protein Cas7/Cse4/CasC n=1 Tax=Embleya sp. NPDC008237 TaxID=3363978 RepID=UPI0036E26A41
MTPIRGRFIEAHVIQTIPYSNLNRDDTNSVKTVQFGGVNRTRISSQSWKRAMRLRLQQTLGEEALRTRRLGERVAKVLREEHEWPASLADRAGLHTVLACSVGAEKPKDPKDAKNPKDPNEPWDTNAMVYVPDTAIGELAAIAAEFRTELEGAKDGSSIKPKDKGVLPADRIDAVLRSRNGVINLFGRMLAEIDDAKVDGAAQVAHAFTTHATDTEIDYFSAVDDVTAGWGDETGSAHMGHAEHTAGTLYRYHVLDLADLSRNLGDDSVEDAHRIGRAFLEAAVMSLPAAKKNSTAAHSIPELVHLTVRADRPVSYAGAFEEPVVRPRGGGYAKPSIAALDEYAGAVTRLLGSAKAEYSAYASSMTKDPTHLGARADSYEDLVRAAVDAALAPADAPEASA